MDHSFPRNFYLFGGLDKGVKGGGNFGVEGMYESLWMGIGLDGYHTRSATGGMRPGGWIWRTGGRSEAMHLARVVPWLEWLSFCFLKCKVCSKLVKIHFQTLSQVKIGSQTVAG